MERQAPQDSKPLVAYNTVAIVLGATSFDPAHINPDFLRYNEIVGAAWQIDQPVIIESGFSRVRYHNGLMFTATDDFLTVSQNLRDIDVDETVVPDVVRRYLAMSPWLAEYQHVSFDITGTISAPGSGFEPHLSPFNDLALQIRFEENVPTVQVRCMYRMTDWSVILYVYENMEENVIKSLRFSAHIHRDIDDHASPDERDEFISAALEKWDANIRDFDDLACQFYFTYADKED